MCGGRGEFDLCGVFFFNVLIGVHGFRFSGDRYGVACEDRCGRGGVARHVCMEKSIFDEPYKDKVILIM